MKSAKFETSIDAQWRLLNSLEWKELDELKSIFSNPFNKAKKNYKAATGNLKIIYEKILSNEFDINELESSFNTVVDIKNVKLVQEFDAKIRQQREFENSQIKKVIGDDSDK